MSIHRDISKTSKHDDLKESLKKTKLPKVQNDYINDPDFKQFSKKVNNYNSELFLKAYYLNDLNAKNIGYVLASIVNNGTSKNEVSKIFESFITGTNCLLNDKDFYKYKGVINKYNISSFAEALNIKVKKYKRIAYKIASHVDNNYMKEMVLKEIKSYNEGKNNLIKDQETSEYLENINKYNIKLFNIAKDFSDLTAKKAAYKLASIVKDKEFEKEVYSLFKAHLRGNNHLLIDKDFHKYLYKNNDANQLLLSFLWSEVEPTIVNKYNLSLFVKSSKYKDQQVKKTAYGIASDLIYENDKKKYENIFEAFNKNLIPKECFDESLFRRCYRVSDICKVNDRENKLSNDKENVLFENLHNINILNKNEININDTSTYEKLPNGMLCYQGNNLFIKKNNGLSKLNLTKEVFNILFPNNSLIIFSQGRVGDCFFLSVMYGLLNNIDGREKVLNCFSLDKNGDLLFTLSKDKPIKFKSIRDKNGKINNFKIDSEENAFVKGSLGWRIMEKAFSLYSIGFQHRETNNISERDMACSYDFINGGEGLEVFHKFEFFDTRILTNKLISINNEQEIISDKSMYDLLVEYLNKNKGEQPIIHLGTIYDAKEMGNFGICRNHGYSLIKIKDEEIYLSDPHNTARYLVINKEILDKYFENITCCIPSIETFQYDTSSIKDYESFRWWQNKINKLEDSKKRASLLNKIQKNRSLYQTYIAFIRTGADPYILLNDPHMIKYFNQIDISNIIQFIKASEIKDEKSRKNAYKLIAKKITSSIENGVLPLFEYLKNNDSNILKDTFSSKIFTKINRNNLKFFIEAAKISDRKKREIAYKLASSKINKDRRIKVFKLIKKLSKPDTILKNVTYYKYFGIMNDYNEKLFNELDNIQNKTLKLISQRIISKVKDEKTKAFASEIIMYLKSNNPFKNLDICEIEINKNNLSLLAKAIEFQNPDVRKSAVLLATQIKSLEGAKLALKLFEDTKNGTNHLLYEKKLINIFETEIENSIYFQKVSLNLELNINAGEIKNYESRSIAYQISNKVFTSYGRKGAKFIIELLKDDNNIFINDDYFKNCINEINEENIIHIYRATLYKDPEVRHFALKNALRVTSKNQHKADILFYTLSKEPDEILMNKEKYQYYIDENNYNKKLFKYALEQNGQLKPILLKIASVIDNYESQYDGGKLIDLLISEKSYLAYDKIFIETINSLKKENIRLFIQALEKDNEAIRHPLCQIAAQFSTKNYMNKTLNFFEKLKDNDYNLLKDSFFLEQINKISFNEPNLYLILPYIKNEEIKKFAFAMFSNASFIYLDSALKAFELIIEKDPDLLNDPDFFSSRLITLNEDQVESYIKAAKIKDKNLKIENYEKISTIIKSIK